MTDEPVEHDVAGVGGVRLRVLDHGGDGPPAVVMHGAGGNLRNWDVVARRLDGRVRLVAFDVRGHGQSEPGEDFSAATLVGDVEAVIGALGLGNPVVAGHSMGGMIAAHYGASHPEAPHVINIDGHGTNAAPSMPSDAKERWVRAGDAATPSAPAAESGDDAWLAEQLDAARTAIEQAGASWERVEPGIRHSFRRDESGTWHRQPTFAFMEQMVAKTLNSWTMFEVYRRVECPIPVVDTLVPRVGLPPEVFHERRSWIIKDFAGLTAERTNTTVVELDAEHSSALFAGATRVAELLQAAAHGR